jgi:hypothetical protein
LTGRKRYRQGDEKSGRHQGRENRCLVFHHAPGYSWLIGILLTALIKTGRQLTPRVCGMAMLAVPGPHLITSDVLGL